MLPCDRLWVSVVRASVCGEDERRWDGELTLGYGELWEYLYHNHTHINHIVKPVSVSPVSSNNTPLKPHPLHLPLVMCNAPCRYCSSMATTL